jgi:DAACS family dicarboxylate/amino acid:cation (Na+ or H+) symporter
MHAASHRKLLLGLILGVVAGAGLHALGDLPVVTALDTYVLQPIGQIFLRLIFMTVVPLVFSALVLGVHELGRGQGLGRVASRTLLWTLVASSSSVVIGIALVNLIRPGAGFAIDPSLLAETKGAVGGFERNLAESKPFVDALVELVPKNPVEAATKALSGEMISLMVFALVFGTALSAVDRERSGDEGPVVRLLEQVLAASMRIVGYAMRLAPVAVFAIVFHTIHRFGAGILGSLALFVVTVVLGLLIQQVVVYGPLLAVFAKRSPWAFFRACREVYLYAFSTASSNATLPLSISTAEHDLKLPPDVARFVLTVGSTANQNGTALFEGITVLFLAQVYGVDLSLAEQARVVLMSILAGVGTAGVPGGSLPLIMILLQSVGIPAEGIGLILGADRFLDMCRTTLNVSGDLVIAALVSAGYEEPAHPASAAQDVADTRL